MSVFSGQRHIIVMSDSKFYPLSTCSKEVELALRITSASDAIGLSETIPMCFQMSTFNSTKTLSVNKGFW